MKTFYHRGTETQRKTKAMYFLPVIPAQAGIQQKYKTFFAKYFEPYFLHEITGFPPTR